MSGPDADEATERWLAALDDDTGGFRPPVEVEAWGDLTGPERRHNRARRVGFGLAGVATAVLAVALVAVGVVAVPRVQHLFVPSPVLFTGEVTRQGSEAGARPSPADDVQVDVYLDPAQGGQPVALASATTDRHGDFTLRSGPPPDVDLFIDGHRQIEATVVFQDNRSNASLSISEELEWIGSSRSWRLLTPDASAGTTGGSVQVALVVLPGDLAFTGCNPDTHLMLDWMRKQVEQELAQARRRGTCH